MPPAPPFRGLRATGGGSFDVRAALRRSRSTLPAVVQIVVAATVAYGISHVLLGHAVPLFAVTITISSLGLARDARPRRVAENAAGVLVGIVLTELLLLVIGKGVWQVGVVILVTLLVARFFTAQNAFAISAATQGAIVMLLPDPAGGPFVRSIDGLVGGAVALLITALLPRDPIGLARADARRLFVELGEAFDVLVLALRHADVRRADDALSRLRSTQPLLDDWSATLESARSISRISPFLRRRLPMLDAQAQTLRYVDLAVRNLRVVTRRIDTSLGDGRRRAEVGDLIASIARATSVLGQSLDQVELRPAAVEALGAVARRLDPATLLPGAPVGESVLVLMLRPLVIDLLMAAGQSHEAARAALPPA